MPVAETFRALGDPIRLEIVKRLSDGPHHTIGGLSDGLGLTRQGARKHIQVLADVKLVSLQTKGRQTEVSLDRASLAEAKSFIADLELRWDHRLNALRKFIEKESSTISRD
ncbi:MAG TPA: helix-turn-helix domain-containing protein [Candidatus Saccharimonadales bacterium]|nr:helix-turn-helix domain-containing protein [Candidatus Saccharimonadales bacterium]